MNGRRRYWIFGIRDLGKIRKNLEKDRKGSMLLQSITNSYEVGVLQASSTIEFVGIWSEKSKELV